MYKYTKGIITERKFYGFTDFYKLFRIRGGGIVNTQLPVLNQRPSGWWCKATIEPQRVFCVRKRIFDFQKGRWNKRILKIFLP